MGPETGACSGFTGDEMGMTNPAREHFNPHPYHNLEASPFL